MTREETMRLLQFLAGCYPNKKITDPKGMIDAYMLAFSDDDAGDIYKAARHHMMTNKYFPTPADIRDCLAKGRIIYNDEQLALQADNGIKALSATSGGQDEDLIPLFNWACDTDI